MTSNRETVPAERLEQMFSLKANFLLSGTAEQQQDRCKKPTVGNGNAVKPLNNPIPPRPRPHSLVMRGRQPNRLAFVRGHLLDHFSVQWGIVAATWSVPAEDRAGKIQIAA